MHGGKRIAEGDAEGGDVLRRQRATGFDDALQGAAADEVAPEADAAVVAIDTVSGDDAGVANFCEGAGLGDDLGVLLLGIEVAGQQEFEGDFALEHRIPRAVDFAECALSDALEELERSPL